MDVLNQLEEFLTALAAFLKVLTPIIGDATNLNTTVAGHLKTVAEFKAKAQGL
jgi:hypothetical protein